MSENESRIDINRKNLDEERIAEDAFSGLEMALCEGVELAKQTEAYFLRNLDHLRKLLKIFEEEHSNNPMVLYYIEKMRQRFGILAFSVEQQPDKQSTEA